MSLTNSGVWQMLMEVGLLHPPRMDGIEALPEEKNYHNQLQPPSTFCSLHLLHFAF